MNIKEFYDLGFITEFVDETPVGRRVLPIDDHYQECLEYARTHTDREATQFAWQFRYHLVGWSTSGSTLTRLDMSFSDEKSHRVIIAFGSVRLDVYCNKETGFIYSIWDRFSYMGETVISSAYKKYECRGEKSPFLDSETYIHNAKEFMEHLAVERTNNSKKVRAHYNQEIKKLKQEYRRKLDNSNKGVKDLFIALHSL